MAESKTSEPILKEALEQFEASESGSEFNRADARADIEFGRLGEQWPKEVRELRRRENRPCLTINKLPPLVRHVVNESRQNKPAIAVHPVDNGADKNTAEVITGIVRSIERNSDAGIAYDTAIDHAVTSGFGFFQVGIDYAHPESFAMEARIYRIPDPLMVHWDVDSTAFDASDWGYGFISDWLTKKEYERRYPKAALVSFEGANSDDARYWLHDEQYRIAQYWRREEKKRKILLLSNGSVIREDLFDEMQQAIAAANGFTVVRDRESTYYEVTRRLISGAEVLEEEKWPGSTIPICPVWGEEVILDGRRYFRSMIRDAKDPQSMFNFWRTATTELVALAPKAPWLGQEGFIPEGQEEKWQTANSRSHAYLEYSRSVTQMPQRQQFASVPAGALQESVNANEDMQAITGIYPSSIGERSNETSGKAIMARERQGNTSNFHFLDNLARGIGYAGKVIVEILPYVYNEQETVRILGADMKEKVVRLIRENPAGMEGKAEIEGDDGPMYNLSVGKYDVDVKQGPSYSTQREETRETLTEIITQVPGAATILGDILMEHMDFQGADKVAKRLQYLLPPQVQAAEGIALPPMPMQPGMPAGPMAGPGMAPQPVPGAPPAQPAMPAGVPVP